MRMVLGSAVTACRTILPPARQCAVGNVDRRESESGRAASSEYRSRWSATDRQVRESTGSCCRHNDGIYRGDDASRQAHAKQRRDA